MSKKTENYYFNNFIESINLTCEAAIMLNACLTNFDASVLPQKLDEMHEIEHQGDNKKHKLTSEIVRAFITPIERDDIIQLSQNIDNVTDSIEDILIHIYINHITVIPPEAIEFSEVVIRCCQATRNMMEEFRHFKKSKRLRELVIEINRIEETGDAMFIRLLHDLQLQSKDPLYIIAWREIYNYFEKCCDACEDVADIVESIAITNS